MSELLATLIPAPSRFAASVTGVLQRKCACGTLVPGDGKFAGKMQRLQPKEVGKIVRLRIGSLAIDPDSQHVDLDAVRGIGKEIKP